MRLSSHLFCVLLSIFAFVLANGDEFPDVPPDFATVETYSSVNHTSYTTIKKSRSGVKGPGVKGRNRKEFKGGCIERPAKPINGYLTCSSDSGCRANCDPGHKFPNGEVQLVITCSDKKWNIRGTDWTSVPHCEPSCLPRCQNNGICVAPNECRCSDGFSGPQCQFKNEPCLNPAPLVMHAHRQCNSKTCTFSCFENFVFPNGARITNVICKNGIWESTRSEWVTIPDCQPVCSPPCQNGGICLPLNMCQCPQDFQGPQCQYSADVCRPEKLGFNGGYHCRGVPEGFACTLNCPAGVEFTSPPISEYLCTFEKGYFEPQPIPQCETNGNYKIIPVESTHNSFYQITNHTWTFEDIIDISHQTSQERKGSYGSRDYYDFEHSMVDKNDVSITGSSSTKTTKTIRPEPKTCFTWGGVHYKTFDGTIYNFESSCSYTLIQETRDNTFTVTIENSPGCTYDDLCHRILKVFVLGKEYSISLNTERMPIFRNSKKNLPIPSQLTGLRVEMAANFLIVTLDSVGLTIKWDRKLFVQIEASESLWNRTSGLCGKMNGDADDDLVEKNGDLSNNLGSLTSSWRVERIGEICDETPNLKHSCLSNEKFKAEATNFCSALLADQRFHSCSGIIDLSLLENACQWDYCACRSDDKRECACNTMNVYVRQCAHQKIINSVGWRRNDTCPISCSNGRIYMTCGPKSQPSCSNDVAIEAIKGNDEISCEEGCFCPSGTVLHEEQCISVEQCPCRLRGKLFQPGASVPKGCNTCTCLSGKWLCTQTLCGGRCAAVGDPHYVTFDGKHFDFMGKCNYYLLKGDNYSIESENVACSGAISENMGYSRSSLSDQPSCTKSVTIRSGTVSIKLKQNHQVLVNSEDITKLPIKFGGMKIRAASSIFLIVSMPNGLEIWWDSISRVYINAPADFRGKTSGLCGTFTANQKDDFLTSDGDVEQSVVPFANKWKTNEICLDSPPENFNHPCDANPQKHSEAKTYCSKLWSDLFSECHWHVDPEPFYKDCMFDMCACETSVELCLCPTIAAYAAECAIIGVKILWRLEVEECKIHCTRGQEYQICGDSCTRSCGDISFHEDCKHECVEGCNCPVGESLNIHGECIPIGQCPCSHGGLEFRAGYREVRSGTKSQELCTCAGGRWNCLRATPEDVQNYPPAGGLASVCTASKNLKVSSCEPIEPRTCRNMHKPIDQTPAVCKPGCVCKDGYVKDSPSGACVKKEECPCYHGGKSYKEGSSIQEECNTCRCESGKWKCTDRACAGICTAWGDSHYKTFDGRLYDFQGVCDYVLVKARLSPDEVFEVSTQNVPCGSSGVTCSKSITFIVGNGAGQETITLIRGKNIPKVNLKRIAVRKVGLFVFLDCPDLGVVVQWDEGTRVYVKVHPKWRSHTKGLCGDYNGNSEDDYKTPSGGVSEISPRLFADSWKKEDYCAEPKDILDTCAIHPERKSWAIEKCGVLKTELFESCHSEVELEPYLEKCIFDTCGCDAGGDCECLCTALSAYAHECNTKGVPVKWRSQELCPMQCDQDCSSYSPCISTCPLETCDNILTLKSMSHLCAEDTCVEGCQPKLCPDNQVYQNNSMSGCVPKETCKLFCLNLNGITYYEGEEMKSDDCQSCFCSRGKIVCSGEPCATTLIPEITTVLMEQKKNCIDGWSDWINNDSPAKGKINMDIEVLPSTLDLLRMEGSAVCTKEQMVDIKCRTVEGHQTPKETGLNVECSLERGLYCEETTERIPCVDFEISVLCRCHPLNLTTQETTTSLRPTIPESTLATLIQRCNATSPNQPHPTDCHAFYECINDYHGVELVEKNCGPDMMYNEKLFICDWPVNVIAIRPECGIKSTTPSTTIGIPIGNEATTPSDLCVAGESWSDCAVQCNQTCKIYLEQLKKEDRCTRTDDCIPGCVKNECSRPLLWRDFHTCVDIKDCPCKSHSGELVKPDSVIKESECEVCQCLSDYYTCDSSLCMKTTIIDHPRSTISASTEPTKTEPPPPTTRFIQEYTILVTTHVSPAEECLSKDYLPLRTTPLELEMSFSASSSLGEKFEPKYWNSNNEVYHSEFNEWQPLFTDSEQWLAIEFHKPEPLYGIMIQGSSLEDKYVTSYKVLFSEDDLTFSYMLNDEGKPQVFRGPSENNDVVKQIFNKPIEAKVIKINPQSWHKGISMRVDVLGCSDHFTTPINIYHPTTETPVPTNHTHYQVGSTTGSPQTTRQPMPETTIIEKTSTPVCDDSMGFDNGLLPEAQIEVSSALDNCLPNLRISTPGLWRPKLDNPHQYVQFDFFEPRDLTGIETRGAENVWTTVYKVYYSIDGRMWNPLIDSTGAEKEFLGNFDDVSTRINHFDRPIHARYLKINPIKWHRHVGLKAEVHGCYLPYPVQPTVSVPKTSESPTSKIIVEKEPPECNVCEGIVDKIDQACRCMEMYWWNGESCVTKHECPCVVETIPYAVGTRFETEDCQECICSLGGTSICQPKKCSPCNEPNLRSIVTELCSCVCKPCNPGTRLCPTSNLCLNDTLWCNGVQDCPDDETGCEDEVPERPFPTMVMTTTHTQTINRTEVVTLNVTKAACEKPVCSPGYKLVSFTKYPARKSWSSRRGQNRSPTKSNTKTMHRKQFNQKLDQESKSVETRCPEFSCIPYNQPSTESRKPGSDTCPKVECPPGYKVVFVQLSMQKLVACPKYTCYPPPPVEVVCNVTGRTFNTFDNLEYKYDICNHILARHMDDNKWYITLEKHCPKHPSHCIQILSITIDEDDIVLYPDMRVDIGDYRFTSKQINSLGNNRRLFKISLIGDVLYFVSNKYGFWVIWDKSSNVKIGVTTQLATKIDGLCGYFDGFGGNDRQKPDGSLAKNTLDFGNSWAMDYAPQCEKQVCPYNIHQRAWEICGTVKESSLRAYSSIINLDKFISRCMETTCNCIIGNATDDDCRCRALLLFVKDCQSAEQNADLSDWRAIHNCPIHCPAPLVHKDCFRKKCEMSCSNLQEPDPCPVMPGVCFSGCFCPDGMVRHGDDCVYPSECRDCICDGFGNSNFITFDKRNFTFPGNCTYTLSRDVTKGIVDDPKNHTYEILMTNVPCAKGVCTESITVLYDNHIIQIRKGTNEKLEAIIDGIPTNLSQKSDWLSIQDGQNHNIILLIPAIQMELTIFHHSFAFTIKLPSHTFGDATEGLCGNCNGIIEDDLKTKGDEITEDINVFGMSWLVTEDHSGLKLNKEHCTSEPPKPCNEETANLTLCKILEDSEPFGKCHDAIDPSTFVVSCRETICRNGDVCEILEAYARSCSQAGLCLDWRTREICPYKCSSDLEYQSCGSGCKKTCDSITKKENCLLAPTEGCFCPEQHVFHNGTCVPEVTCLVCDEKGHVSGDIWQPDKCTSCSCTNKTVICEKTDCPALDAVCQELYTPVVVPGSDEQCCPKYLCVPVPTTSPPCIEPQQPECGFGQTMKISLGADGCQKIICECLPIESCPSSENDVTFNKQVLEPGYEQVVNNSGCCPRLTKICRPELCPIPPTCPKFYNVSSEKREDSCCPDYECKPPKKVCLYTLLPSNDLPSFDTVVAKEIGEEWKENNCKTCKCEFSGGVATVNCLASQCPEWRDSAEAKEFVIEEEFIENECCPSLKRKACRHGKDVYHVGDKWNPELSDICNIVECVDEDGKINKKLQTEVCNVNCDEGYDYRPSKNKSLNCCGECVAVACVVDGKVREIGEQWFSDDHCVTYNCLSKDGAIFVKEKTEQCPKIDASEVKRFKLKKVTIPEQCCSKNVRTACIYEDIVYEVGEKWTLKNNTCVTEMCVEGHDGVTVRQETQICNTVCPKGWVYEKSSIGECCGECKETMCVVGDTFYEPGAVWYSNNNCTVSTCMKQTDQQLVVSSSSPTCPDLSDCPERGIYFDGCCKRCNITELNQQRACAADVLDLDTTIGILVEKNHRHGICRNLYPIKGLTECHGSCSSSTQFDTETWNQIYKCDCCQPRETKTITVQISCDDGKIFDREITVPTSCTCQSCGSQKQATKGRRKGVKG